jgi:hypothetical protein
MAMDENDIAKAGQRLDEAQVTQVAGGDLCTPQQYLEMTKALKESYDNLVDFTSYVFERVLGP